jgi:hypothetical protein
MFMEFLLLKSGREKAGLVPPSGETVCREGNHQRKEKSGPAGGPEEGSMATIFGRKSDPGRVSPVSVEIGAPNDKAAF